MNMRSIIILLVAKDVKAMMPVYPSWVCLAMQTIIQHGVCAFTNHHTYAYYYTSNYLVCFESSRCTPSEISLYTLRSHHAKFWTTVS